MWQNYVCTHTYFFSGGAANRQTKFCKAGPFDLWRIEGMNVTMGNAVGDGTNDDVRFKLGSDVDEKNACTKRLHRFEIYKR